MCQRCRKTSGEGPSRVPLTGQVFGNDRATAAAGQEQQQQPSHLRGVVVIADTAPHKKDETEGDPDITAPPQTLRSAQSLNEPLQGQDGWGKGASAPPQCNIPNGAQRE